MVFFWVPTERTLGISQRIFYIHVPAAWVGFLAFAIVALCSAVYLWLGDDRLDLAARSAAEGGFVFISIMLTSGPLWARLAWGHWWTWEPRLTLSLLLWFIYLGYFMERSQNVRRHRSPK
jgi:heme exporter protein C